MADADANILAMSYICPFQLNALGHSPFCGIFTAAEWRDFNYARDLGTYYGSGYPLKYFSDFGLVLGMSMARYWVGRGWKQC